MSLKDANERPPASGDYEQEAFRLFPLEMSPEEYAARYGHGWMCFSFDEYRYADSRLDTWIQRLGDIFFGRNGAPSVADLRRRLLTDLERAAIEREIEAMQEDY